MNNTNIFKTIRFLFFAVAILISSCNYQVEYQEQTAQGISFISAGHAYGQHKGENIGIYPKFLSILQEIPQIDALFLVGDIVRTSNTSAWKQVSNEIDPLSCPVYYVMGNHDYSDEAIAVFNRKFGNTYYGFTKKLTTFIVLDCQKDWGRITDEQLVFLKKMVSANSTSKNIFIFFHELIWTQGKSEYSSVNHNWGTYEGKFVTNFWDEMFPVITSDSLKSYFVIAGDVGGNPGKIPAFYQKLSNVTLIATGMGEIVDENYLLINISNLGKVTMELISLNEDNELKKLEYYCLENISY